MFDKFFRLSENKTTVRTELLAGVTTFLTMAYIIFVQPTILSRAGMDFYSIMMATCLAAALATLIMGLYARYPIGQAPGMGENFFFVYPLVPAAADLVKDLIAEGKIAGELGPGGEILSTATEPWQIALGVICISGVLFLLLSVLGVREKLLLAISPSMRNAIAVGIGMFIAFIGLRNATLVEANPYTCVTLNHHFASPDLIIFFYGLLVTASLHALRVRGAIIWGIAASTVLTVVLFIGLPFLLKDSSFEKTIAVKTSGAGLTMDATTSWKRQPGTEPLQITFTAPVPDKEDRALTVQLLLGTNAEDPEPDEKIIRHVEIPANEEHVQDSMNASPLARAAFYKIVVTEDDKAIAGLSSKDWTAVPTLPPVVADSKLMNEFKLARGVVSRPPSMLPTLFKMDLVLACCWRMVPFILIFLFMDLFDTLGTLIGVSEQAGLVKDGKLPRANRALMSDAVGTVAGAAMGTSTVTSFIESAAGVEQGGRTGLTAVTVGCLFLVAIFFSPIIGMVGSYLPITAPALVVVGSMMMRNITKIDWSNYAEAMPAFLIIIGIPLTYSIADGLALGFIAYPIIKLCAKQGRDVKWLMYVMALVLVAYFLFVRVKIG